MSYAGIFTDKNNIDHPITSTLYGTCSTAAATAAKEVVCSNVDSLEAGMTLRVVFTNANTAASPTINVNSKGAKNVYRFGSTTPIGGNSWEAGAVVDLFYDGTSFFMLNSDNLGTAAAKAATNAVTENSTDLVESGAVYTGLATKADLTDLAPAFSTSTAYTVGQYVSYDGNLYKCTSAHSAGAWVAGDFTLVAVGSELESKQNASGNSTLTTTDKTIVGAINEVNSKITTMGGATDLGNVQGSDTITLNDAITNYRFVQVLIGYYASGYPCYGQALLPVATIIKSADDIPVTIAFTDRNGVTTGKADVSFLSATSAKVVNTSSTVYTKFVGIA